MMRGKQPHEDLWKMLLSRNSRCKGTGVGMSLEEQETGSIARPQHMSRKEYEIIACKW